MQDIQGVETLKERAQHEYFNAVSANEWKRAGIAVLLEDGRIFSASPLTYSFAPQARESETEVLFSKVRARYGHNIPKVQLIVRAVEDRKDYRAPRFEFGGKPQ